MSGVLTAKQQKVLNAIYEFQRLHDRMPTHQELKERLNFKSVNSVQQYLKALKNKGYLDIEKNKSRGISLKDNSSEVVSIPLLGRVACGLPIFAEENIEAYMPVDKQIVGSNSQNYFFLTAQGDSMNEAGIDDQDLLLIESRQDANPNDIVVALIGDEATVKYFKPSNDYVALIPKSSNPEHKPIILAENFSIQGVVKRVFKEKDLAL